ncbi:MAG: translesion DNA synthesis-associated protein ImuA [Chromatiales bacterium]|nr:translesion DNA synthesis-associated protein ImuA [Chromatiales bacterium]
MADAGGIDELLRGHLLWRGPGRAAHGAAPLPSGFPVLDQALAGGWPVGVLTELLVDHYGIGELSLLLPALARLGEARPSHWLMLVAPPCLPYAPALEQAGIPLSRLLLVHAQGRDEVFWACEQGLRSGSCAAVLAFPGQASLTGLRRLQLAARDSGAWTVLFRPASSRRQPSPAALRIALAPEAPGFLAIEIFKSRVSGRPLRLRLCLDGAWP